MNANTTAVPIAATMMPPASAPTIVAMEHALLIAAVTSASRPLGALIRVIRGHAGAVSAETVPFARFATSSTM